VTVTAASKVTVIGDSRTDTVAAVRGGGGDSSNFGGSVEQDGDIVAVVVRHS
jgi:hypothetical protein